MAVAAASGLGVSGWDRGMGGDMDEDTGTMEAGV